MKNKIKLLPVLCVITSCSLITSGTIACASINSANKIEKELVSTKESLDDLIKDKEELTRELHQVNQKLDKVNEDVDEIKN